MLERSWRTQIASAPLRSSTTPPLHFPDLSTPSLRCFLSSKTFRHGHRLQHRSRFVHRLIELSLGSRIRHPPAPCLNISLGPFQQSGPDCNATVQVAIKREIAHTTSVRSAGGLFQLGNDLHRTNLGSAA